MAFGDMSDVGRRVGMTLTIAAAGALAGPPISGAINNATHGFKAVGYYAGKLMECGRVYIYDSDHLKCRECGLGFCGVHGHQSTSASETVAGKVLSSCVSRRIFRICFPLFTSHILEHCPTTACIQTTYLHVA